MPPVRDPPERDEQRRGNDAITKENPEQIREGVYRIDIHPAKNRGERDDHNVEIDRCKQSSESGVRKSDPLVLRLLPHLLP